ncbi:MAG: hypothetical protein Q8M08_17410 [Bacteroidales bacterium]|nr:hypothetical protein [Bacteroidales bacterium]
MSPEKSGFFFTIKALENILSFIIHARRRILAVMNSTYIQLSAALDLMDQLDGEGKPVNFHVKFVTADRIRRSGGEIIEIQSGRKCVGKRSGKTVFDSRKKADENPSISRQPNHWVNSTRNILLPNGGIRKVHIRLIIEFNNQKVFF